MNHLAASTGDEQVMLWFFLLCSVVLVALRVFGLLPGQVQGKAGGPPSASGRPPAEIASIVSGLAQRSLSIGSHQLDESMELLRIPRGDFLGFLDELEEDHDLPVPASARAMSTSVSGVIAALCRGT
jgi:hypothetical protein